MSSPKVFPRPSSFSQETMRARRRSSSSSFASLVKNHVEPVEPTIRLVAASSSPESSPSALGSSSRYLRRSFVGEEEDDRRYEEYEDITGFVIDEPRSLSSLSYRPSAQELTASTSNSYSSAQRKPSIRSFISGGMDVINLAPSMKSLLSGSSTSIRKDSENTKYTLNSSSSTKTTDSQFSKHSSLNDKFTQKWPKPRSLRIIDLENPTAAWKSRKGLSAIDKRATMSTLEDGLGLGMDRMDRWTGFKWCLLISVGTVLCYGAGIMVCAILTWFRTWDHADVMYVADNDILILITLSASTLMFTALLGLTGALLNSRPILATYAVLLWPALISMLVVGYSSYKRWAFALDHKLNFSWSQYYTPLGRLLIQSSLRCCGYYNPLHEATPSSKCYTRSSLPGCKAKLYRFERENLYLIWSSMFGLVAVHVGNIVVALLCVNHVTRTFGEGVMPREYRLSRVDLLDDAEKIWEEMSRMKVGCVSRPGCSRAFESGMVFREDREERIPLLDSKARR